jgi:hypothetical protein
MMTDTMGSKLIAMMIHPQFILEKMKYVVTG